MLKTLGGTKTRLDYTWLKVLLYLNKRRNLRVHQSAVGQKWTSGQRRMERQSPCHRRTCRITLDPFSLMMAIIWLISGTVQFYASHCGVTIVPPFILNTKWMINYMGILSLNHQPSMSHLFSHPCPLGVDPSLLSFFRLFGWSVLIFDCIISQYSSFLWHLKCKWCIHPTTT